MSKPNFGFLTPLQSPPGAVHCPHCRQPIQLVPALAGMPVPCPFCRKQLTMPGQPMLASPSPQIYQQANPHQSRGPTTSPAKPPARKKQDLTLIYIIAGVLVFTMLGGVVYAVNALQTWDVRRPVRQALEITPAQKRQQAQALKQLEAEMARDQQQLERELQQQLQQELQRRPSPTASRANANFSRTIRRGVGP